MFLMSAGGLDGLARARVNGIAQNQRLAVPQIHVGAELAFDDMRFGNGNLVALQPAGHIIVNGLGGLVIAVKFIRPGFDRQIDGGAVGQEPGNDREDRPKGEVGGVEQTQIGDFNGTQARRRQRPGIDPR